MPFDIKTADNMHVSGIMSQLNETYYDISVNSARTIVTTIESTQPRIIEERLAAKGVTITSTQKRELQKKMSMVSLFEPRLVAKTPGWTGPHYYLLDGTCFSPPDQDPPLIAFVPALGKNRQAGTMAEWRDHVAQPLTGQTLLTFLMMMMFVGPLLRFSGRDMNILMELHGPPATGKTTWLRVVATCLGARSGRASERYPVSLNGTSNAIEEIAVAHNDAALIADEAQLYNASLAAANRAKAYKELIFRLSDGTSKARFQGENPVDFNIVAIFGTNEDVANVTGGDSGSVQRLLTLPVVEGGGLGVLDFIPEGHDSAVAFISHINKMSATFFGAPFRTFLEKLVPLIAKDEAAFTAKLEHYVFEFYDAVSVEKNSGDSVRVAESFALAAVAGRLARRFGIFPATWDPTAIAAACYHRHLAFVQGGLTVEARLRAHAARSDVLKSDKKSPRIAPSDWQTCVGVVIDQEGPDIELLIPTHAIKSVFPAWASIRSTPAVLAMLRINKDGRLASQRRILASDKKPRVYTFVLPR